MKFFKLLFKFIFLIIAIVVAQGVYGYVKLKYYDGAFGNVIEFQEDDKNERNDLSK